MKWFTRHHTGRERTVTDQVAAAAHQERRALARDLHDGVSQDLYATHLALTALRDQVPESVQPSVDRLIGRQVRTMALLRAVVDRRMAPEAPVSTDDLVTSLDRLVAHELGGGVQVCRSGEAPTEVPAILAQHAWRSLREMLSNAIRHSGAGHIEVDIDVDDQWITLRVDDDGPGITAPVRAGHGLVSLESRARQCDGSFQLRRRAPTGTTALWRARTDGCHQDATAKALSRA
jgi:signal transduction histidine kinase